MNEEAYRAYGDGRAGRGGRKGCGVSVVVGKLEANGERQRDRRRKLRKGTVGQWKRIDMPRCAASRGQEKQAVNINIM